MEVSPAESFLSIPSDNYASLFTGQSSKTSSPTINPIDAMTPVSTLPTEALSPCVSSTPAPEDSPKEPKKKRKSWGQVLPEPKTNLPPRKRAKTEDEKEQRRVERVLRNRRAAQSSRERKRAETDHLLKRNEELEEKIRLIEQKNMQLQQELQRVQHAQGKAPPATANFSLDRTLASGLFTDATNAPQSKTIQNPTNTINMAKLSPPPEVDASNVASTHELQANDQPEPSALQLPAALSFDVTQHSAAMLCDLQCQSEPDSNRDAQAWTWMVYLATMLRVSILSVWQRPLTQISLSLKTGSPLPPTPSILTTILSLVTRVTPSTTPLKCQSTSTSRRSTALLRSLGWRSPTAATTSGTSTRVTNLKVKLLRKILSSSPMLARPLKDATLAALRLVSSESHNLTVNTPVVDSMSSPVDGELTQLLKQMSLPRREVLLALALTIQLEIKRMERRQSSSNVGGTKSTDAVSRHSIPGVTESVALQDTAA